MDNEVKTVPAWLAQTARKADSKARVESSKEENERIIQNFLAVKNNTEFVALVKNITANNGKYVEFLSYLTAAASAKDLTNTDKSNISSLLEQIIATALHESKMSNSVIPEEPRRRPNN